MHDVGSDGAAHHSRINSFACRSGYEASGVADQNRAAFGERRYLVNSAGGIQCVVGVGNIQVLGNQLRFTCTLEKCPHDLPYVGAVTGAATDADADVLPLRENPSIAIQPIESQRDKKRKS